jgi:hypothetical protein
MPALMIPEDILGRLRKNEEYRSSLQKFRENPIDDDGDAVMLDADTLRRGDTWNELADKEL